MSLAKRSNREFGHIKGQPLRFILGHKNAPSLEQRFHARVAVAGPDECWEWTGGRVPAGYGALWDRERNNNRHAHRFAWELANGPIPEGMFICHRCDNPPCCNPAHLFLGTQAENDADRTAKGRGIRGERHVDAKLNDAWVREIRWRASIGEPQADLAHEFGVSESTLSAVVLRHTWKHVYP